MQHPNDSYLWRPNFVGALQLLGEAAARQPFGISDPILWGTSAVALYTGGLWSAGCLEVLAADARALIVELFAAGFCWTRRPGYVGRRLWHPGLQIGIDVNDHAPWGLAEQCNVLTVLLDLDAAGPADRQLVSLKVVGIEDLIIEEVACQRRHGAPWGEVATRARVLVALGREGVGGRLRAGYLHRRLVWETHGEAALDVPLPAGAEDEDPVPRVTGLTQMRTLLNAWRVRRGYAFDRPRSGWPHGQREKGAREMHDRNEQWERAGAPGVVSANVIPLDVAQPARPE
jgi:hypothetical protein